MRFSKSALLGVVGSVFLATGAMAADVPPITIAPTPVVTPVVVAPQGFDWAGPYFGAYGGGWFEGLSLAAFDYWLFGGQAGYNFAFGPNLLAGAEVRAGVLDNGGEIAFEGALTARLGYILGSRILLYGEAGVETLGWLEELYWTAGGGVEVGVGRALSVFAEGAVVGDFGGGCCGMILMGGVNWHPGN